MGGGGFGYRRLFSLFTCSVFLFPLTTSLLIRDLDLTRHRSNLQAYGVQDKEAGAGAGRFWRWSSRRGRGKKDKRWTKRTPATSIAKAQGIPLHPLCRPIPHAPSSPLEFPPFLLVVYRVPENIGATTPRRQGSTLVHLCLLNLIYRGSDQGEGGEEEEREGLDGRMVPVRWTGFHVPPHPLPARVVPVKVHGERE